MDEQRGMSITKNFEGFRDTVYKDSMGIPTIGYGFNLQANPGLPRKRMSVEQADQYFVPYYKKAMGIAQDYAGPRYQSLSPMQQIILTDMAYNLNNKLYKFRNMRNALLSGDNNGVTREMQNSNWFKQVGRRSKWAVNNWGKQDGAL